MRMIFFAVGIIMVGVITQFISYYYLKNKILKRKKWGLNICSGRTDGGGVNADIFRFEAVPNFVLIDDIYHLPFRDNQFATCLCSHTMEHVDDPNAFFDELKRVSRDVTVVIPPLWDIAANMNIFEHKWIYVTLKKEHNGLPLRIRMPFSRSVQKIFGQKNLP